MRGKTKLVAIVATGAAVALLAIELHRFFTAHAPAAAPAPQKIAASAPPDREPGAVISWLAGFLEAWSAARDAELQPQQCGKAVIEVLAARPKALRPNRELVLIHAALLDHTTWLPAADFERGMLHLLLRYFTTAGSDDELALQAMLCTGRVPIDD